MMDVRCSIWPGVVLAMLAVVPARGQEFRALVSGRIADSTGAVIANATLTIVSQATGARSTTVTGSDGNFALPQLMPGVYDLTAEAHGFRRYIRQGITLAVGDKVNLQIQLEVGELTSSVTVAADLTGIEANQDITSQLMDNKRMSELPLNGRNVFMLVQLSAGVVFTQQSFAPGGSSGTRGYDLYGQFSVHGSLPNTDRKSTRLNSSH